MRILGMRFPTRRLAMTAALATGLLAASLASAQTALPVTADDMVLGNPKAPITVIEYGSASCTHCAHFNNDIFPAFKKKYVDTGKVRYVFREFITAPPQLAAVGFLLARCSGKAKYFDTLDGVFHAQDQVFKTGDIKTPLLPVAAKAGLNEQQFMACVSDEKAVDALNARVQKWVDGAKIEATPTFDINGKRYQGVQELAALDAAIAEAGKKK
jgi:protein-disulfide isomerase